jgi:hypothetical protein
MLKRNAVALRSGKGKYFESSFVPILKFGKSHYEIYEG